ncbi:uncharacterized protein LOC144657244 isoform X2 [Oculina patagonica]
MVEAERALVAAKDGDLQTLKSLRRSAPFAADGFGATALHYAARTGKIDCVKWLVETLEISPKVYGRSGATPLHDAAAQGELECVKYFLGNGAVDAETKDGSGHTALHLAARFGRFDTVKWLIEKGNSNPRAKSRNHMTPVHFAASGGHLTCLELLVFKAGYSCVNDVATDGTTPLYLASQDGNLDCLKYLHSVDGKCDARARDGMLPIHGAAQNGHLDCVGYLIESGKASLTERDSTGGTPAHYAAAQGHVSVLKWLNAKGDISVTDRLGGTPLHDAAEQGQFECVRYLVENVELDVQQKDKEGLSPLALAEKSGHRKCADYLKIAASKQAKAQKKEMKAKKYYVERDGNKLTTTLETQDLATQTKKNFASKTSATKASSAMSETSEKTSKHQNANDKKEKPNNEKEISLPSLVNAQDSNESTEASPHNPQQADSNVANSPPAPGKPLRERQLLPLPHLGDIIPPPAEFAEYSGTSSRKVNELKGPKEDVKLDEEKASKPTHLSGIFEKPSDNNSVKDDTTLNDCSVIVEDHSLGSGSASRHQYGKSDEARAETIAQEIQSNQPMEGGNYYERGHVTAGGRHSRSDQSANKKLPSRLPPWKRQILVNRMVKEKAREKVEREKKEIEQRKWIGVPLWKIPLLTKREDERLKGEQRWIGMPEWKKNLLRKRGTDRLYRDYHAINTGYPIRRRVSWHLPEMSTADDEGDHVTRPRAISSLE